MPAAVFMGLKDVAVEERPTPKPGPGELLIEVSHCGVCGSDLHFLVEWGGRSDVIEGHEFSGTVVALGPDVTGWNVGDRVVPGQSPKCGECEYCRAGRVSLCIERGRVGADDGDSAASQGAFARLQDHRGGRGAARSRPPLAQARRAGRAPRGRAARHHPGRRRSARHPLARHRRRPDRLPVGRGAEGAGRRRHRRERAQGEASRAVRRSSARARSRPTSSRRRAGRTISSPSRSTSRSSARATARDRRPRSRSSSAPARSCSSARAWRGRSSTRTASCSTSS